ncbi:ABC transporter ATP-binding protein [Halioglobus maricola]|uniref:ABC transporter ATP-binding protein n=1 Tax=Halioglobus maricola TaxID=2601894 RepID=A0A5P9NJZ5_9GAMM|nr:ABC transporter ATP-binding protein [Halioglobus maricola]QFU75909.1 ABC transporter ATP-binding protein [Halioglobus maricola]
MTTARRESNLRFFLRYVFHHKRSYTLGVVFIFLTNYLAVSIPAYIGTSVDLLSGELAANDKAMTQAIAMVIILALVMVVTRTVSRILFFNPGRAIERELKDDAFARLTRMQTGFYREHETGTLISIVNNDINGVRALAGIVMLQVFNVIFALSLTPLKMWAISPHLTLYCIFPVLITFFIAHKGIAFMRRMMKIRMVELQEMSSSTVGFLTGIEVIKSHGIHQWAEDKFDRENVKILSRSLLLARVRTLILPLIGYTDRILKVMILAIGGGYLLNQDLTLGELTALLSYASLLAMPFISLGMIFSAWQNGIVSLESLRRILDEPLIAKDGERLAPESRDKLFSQGLRVDGLTYTYPGATTPTLKNLCFEVKPGQTVGILGRVGSGKTTLVNCINRYLDVDPEQLFIDDNDLTEISRADLRSAVRTITQEPFLFSDTVTENVRFGSESLQEPLSLDQVLKQSDMLDEVRQFPEQEETLVGEKGILLSGGQKQRLSLARGLYTPSKLMILDNVLSAVDNETERFLLNQIFNNSRSQSTLIVSHRATVLEQVDHILVLEEGRIVDQGTHAELLQRSEIYRQTWELQQHDGGTAE